MKDVVVQGKKGSALTRFAEDAISRYPWATNQVLKRAAALLSPFDRALSLEVVRWEERCCELKLPGTRKLRDQQLDIHPGAVTAAGERAAILLLQRNFPFWQYGAELKEVQAVFAGSRKRALKAVCEIAPQDFAVIQRNLQQKGETSLKLKTELLQGKSGKPVAVVRTSWHIKKRKLLEVLWKR